MGLSDALLEQRVADCTARARKNRRVARAEVYERKQAEERLTILVQELAHRVKNLPRYFSPITARTLTGGRSITDAREVLMGAAVLGDAHELLHGSIVAWCRTARELPTAEIAGFSERVQMSGPVVELSPSGVQTFGLIVHELCTNAANFGALPNASGEVVVNCMLGGSGSTSYMNFCWKEFGGPPVKPASHEGFGLSLITAMGSDPTANRSSISPLVASPARYGYRSIPSGPAAMTRPPQCSLSARSPGSWTGCEGNGVAAISPQTTPFLRAALTLAVAPLLAVEPQGAIRC